MSEQFQLVAQSVYHKKLRWAEEAKNNIAFVINF